MDPPSTRSFVVTFLTFVADFTAEKSATRETWERGYFSPRRLRLSESLTINDGGSAAFVLSPGLSPRTTHAQMDLQGRFLLWVVLTVSPLLSSSSQGKLLFTLSGFTSSQSAFFTSLDALLYLFHRLWSLDVYQTFYQNRMKQTLVPLILSDTLLLHLATFQTLLATLFQKDDFFSGVGRDL